ncbi:hypothetical protein HN903_02920 [archaeon]|jgi:hypothetical protein|nr:hypothetical protein [archaeon]MBT7128684.1 hypothetical protein [archaeon]
MRRKIVGLVGGLLALGGIACADDFKTLSTPEVKDQNLLYGVCLALVDYNPSGAAIYARGLEDDGKRCDVARELVRGGNEYSAGRVLDGMDLGSCVVD